MSENLDILKRAEDLAVRCEKNSIVTSTGFLTPAQQNAVIKIRVPNLYLFGGNENSERRIAFFLPFYIEEETFNPAEYIKAIKSVTKFSSPTHMDYLGSLLAQGVSRESIGDIYVYGETAYFYLLPPVACHILSNVERIGRAGAKLEEIPLEAVPVPELKYRKETFTVQSMRLDSVLAGAFRISRTEAAALIRQGEVSLNYEVCLKTDMPTATGDIISAKGYGKFSVGESGGMSRKGRIFQTVYIRV